MIQVYVRGYEEMMFYIKYTEIQEQRKNLGMIIIFNYEEIL